jgi:YidC/Oxa1 family membrane protein insertase
MDRNTTFGFILIAVVLFVWMWLQAPDASKRQHPAVDTTHQVQPLRADSSRTVTPPVVRDLPPPEKSVDSLGTYFSSHASGSEQILTIKTSLYTAELTTKGGLIRRWELNKYLTWDKHPVELVNLEKSGDLSLLFTSRDGKLINTRNLFFNSGLQSNRVVELDGDQEFTVPFTVALGPNRSLVKRLTFRNGKYNFSSEYEFRGMDSVISNYEYQVVWENGLRYAERNSVDESSFAMAYAHLGGELTEVDATKQNEAYRRDITGATDWVATRNKYFIVSLIPEKGKCEGAYLEGVQTAMPDHGVQESYYLGLKMPFKGGAYEKTKVDVYIGPLEYDRMKDFGVGLEQTMNLGAAWIIRPISEYVMIPLIKFLRMFIPNYGIVIIVFSIIIKMALHPLTKTSMKSMRKMQALTPLMNEIREKYKADPQKMNAQVMNLYKEYGVNPASGCLPLLLQMPILFALYAVFRSSIDLRQSAFVSWIQDLAIPDALFNLPFAIPFFGITEVSGLALAMAVTMFIQQKMTVTDPRQKAMVWLMPIMFMLMFNGLPSGLNLYYFTFNLLSIGQQMLFNRQHKAEPLRKVEQKKGGGGFLARITKDLPKMR